MRTISLLFVILSAVTFQSCGNKNTPKKEKVSAETSTKQELKAVPTQVDTQKVYSYDEWAAVESNMAQFKYKAMDLKENLTDLEVVLLCQSSALYEDMQNRFPNSFSAEFVQQTISDKNHFDFFLVPLTGYINYECKGGSEL